jgi:hypothetical protein
MMVPGVVPVAFVTIPSAFRQGPHFIVIRRTKLDWLYQPLYDNGLISSVKNVEFAVSLTENWITPKTGGSCAWNACVFWIWHIPGHWTPILLNINKSWQRYNVLNRILLGVRVLTQSQLNWPPWGPEVALAWAQEQYSLWPVLGTWQWCLVLSISSVAWHLNSLFAWDIMVSCPGSAVSDTKANHLLCIPCHITDNLSASLFAVSISAWIGNETKPSVVLLERHVKWLHSDLDQCNHAAITPSLHCQFAQAGFTNVCFWLGWLRSQELFARTFEDIRVI